jgi:hypothetical protein
MDDAAVARCITEELGRVAVVESSGDTFFFHEEGDRMTPFATIVTSDQVADLSRAGAYRLNIGLTKATYRELFGVPPRDRDERGVLDTGFDQDVADRLMPHPYYASQYWVCVVNPRATTFGAVRPLLAEAYAFAARKAERRARPSGTG